ncbi:MAG: BatA domain-containing protein [Phycisphaerae bacterium]|jgi:Ca-activated chloride channel family protein
MVDFRFTHPQVLWLALLVPVYLWVTRRRITTAAVRYPSVRHLKRLPRSLRQRLRPVLPAMRAAALLLLIVVLARPTRRLETQELPSRGIAIAMLLDRSASMADPDGKLMYNGRLEYRFDIAKDLFQRFVIGDGKDLSGRPNDLVGLFTFATYPRTDHPFSLDHQSVLNVVRSLSAEKPFLDKLGRPTDDPREAGQQADEHGRVLRDVFGRTYPRTNPLQMTDIKKGVEYAAGKLALLAEDLNRSTEGLRRYDLKSKVLVLLTDGEPTVSAGQRGADYPDEDTIRKLVDEGIRIYFIQILAQQLYRERPDGTVEVIVPRQSGLLGQMQADQAAAAVNRAIDEARKLARRTGGRHFLATSGDQLREVYEEINRLERSDVGGRTVFSREEAYGRFLAAALGLLAAEAALGLTVFRRSP